MFTWPICTWFSCTWFSYTWFSCSWFNCMWFRPSSFLVMLSIPPPNRSTSNWLSWPPNYNSKSSAPNNIASPFGKAQSFFSALPRFALKWPLVKKKPQRGSPIPSKPDELSALSEAIKKGKRFANALRTATPGFPGLAPGFSEPDPAPTHPRSIEEMFKQFMQIYMDTVRGQPQPQAPQPDQEASDRPLKAWNPDHYHGNLHIDYYYFC